MDFEYRIQSKLDNLTAGGILFKSVCTDVVILFETFGNDYSKPLVKE